MCQFESFRSGVPSLVPTLRVGTHGWRRSASRPAPGCVPAPCPSGRRASGRAFPRSAWGREALFLQQPQINPPENDLGPLRLEEDLTLGVTGVASFVHLLIVEEVGDPVAVADHFEPVPLADLVFHVVLAA